MMSDVSLNISWLRIFVRILQNKLGVEMLEPEILTKTLSDDMILPQFVEYNYYHETGSKPVLIYFEFVILMLFIIKKLKC